MLDASYVFSKGDSVAFEITTGVGYYQIPPTPYKPTVLDILMDFLAPKFPHQQVTSTDYTSSPAQPGDYTGPYISIGPRIIGYLQQNYTIFVPFSYPNAREEYKSIKIADPKFFDIFHKMAIYEFGYDPAKPGSREAYMDMSSCEYELFHKDVFKIYYLRHECEHQCDRECK